MTRLRKPIIATALLALVCLTAAAQTYSIRVGVKANIRAQPSLDAPRLETVPAGAILEVLSEYNRWLRVNRGGETWMAGWLSQERVNRQMAAAGVNIDNCCSVDRHCQADHEWLAGYWAFQNGQCQAPAAITQTATTTQTQQDSSIDNCCFAGWACQTQQQWIDGFHAFQHGQCARTPSSSVPSATAASHHGRVRIGQLSDGFATMVNAAFDLLRTRAPQWYDYAVNGLNGVQEIHNAEASYVDPGSAIAYFHHAPHSISPYIPQDNITMAEFLVHEACHVYQHREGRLNHSCAMVYDEFECEAKALEASLLIDPNGWNISSMRDFLAHGHNPCR